MHDIIPHPKSRIEVAPVTEPAPIQVPILPVPVQPDLLTPDILPPKKNKKKKKIMWIISLVIGLLIALAVSVVFWYSSQLSPRGVDLGQLSVITIKSGTTPNQIGQLLQDKKIIKSAPAFDVYIRISGMQNKLQAGSYRLSPAETVPQIVEHLVKGSVDQFSVTFLPGATLKDNRKVLVDAGYLEAEIDAAFAKTYTSALFDTKPAGVDLEGYIYGETYNFNAGVSVEDILSRSFDQFEVVIEKNNFVEGFKKQNLTLYQGITLASIIQREVHNSTDQKQVAQIFYKRLAVGMPLGSDVTFIYAASKLGVKPISTLESPYNTRINTGLPPGPIAVPGLTALQAVASPAPGDYLFFLSGDDGITYYATTNDQHTANIRNHCQVKCNTP